MPSNNDKDNINSLLDEQLGSSDTSRPNIARASYMDPDHQAEVIQLAESRNLDTDTVENNLPELKRRTRVESIDTRDYPKLSSYLSDDRNSRVSVDDIDNLKGIEGAVRESEHGFWSNIGRGTLNRVNTLTGNLIEFTGNVGDNFEDYLRDKDIPNPGIIIGDDGVSWSWDIPEETPNLLKNVGRAISEGDGYGYQPRFTWERFKGDMNPKTLAGYIAEQGVQSVPDMMAAIFTLPAYITSRTEEIAEERVKNDEREDVTGQDLATSLVPAVATSLIERIAGKVTLGVGGVTTAKQALKATGAAALTEGGTEFIQEGIEYLGETLGTKKDVSFEEMIDRQLAGLVAGSGMGASIRGATSSYEALSNRAERNVENVVMSTGEQEIIDQIATFAQSSTTRGRKEDRFRNFLKGLETEKQVHISSDAIIEAARNGVELPTYITEQIDGLGTDVTVDMEQFGADIAPNEDIMGALRPHMRLSSESLSPAQMEAADDFSIKSLLERAEKSKEKLTESQVIYEDVKQQLVDTGRQSEATARYSAAIIPAYATVKAEQTGKTVREIYEMMGLSIVGPATVNGDGKTLEQQEYDQAVAKGLDMNQEARMQRASDMGFDVDNMVYRGMADDVDSMRVNDRGVLFVTPDSEYASDPHYGGREGGSVYPLIINPENLFDFDNIEHKDALLSKGKSPVFRSAINGNFQALQDPDVVQALKDEGFSGFKAIDPEGQQSIALFDTSKIRSVNAAFDPDFKESDKLLDQAGVTIDSIKKSSKDQGVKLSVENVGTFDPSDPNIYHQPAQTDGADKSTRGSIRIEDDSMIIKMHQASDLSTFLHESSHLFLEMEGKVAKLTGEVTPDQQTILDWLGVDSFANIDTEQHEKFAETFEVYLREGKAPSLALRDAFAAFKRWLVRIYQNLTDQRLQRAELSPEITEVFDRLLATEAEIELATANPAYDQFFKSKEQAGMTDAEWDAYLKRQEQTRNRSQESVDTKVMKELEHRYSKDWADEKAPMIEEETERLSQEPVYSALNDTSEYPMDRKVVKKLLGVDKLPKQLYGRTVKDGVDPQEYSEFYGYGYPEEMIHEMISVPPLKKAADDAAQKRMIEKYGDILNDGTIEAEAREAIHNETQAQLLLEELRALKPERANKINRDYLKAEAKTLIGSMTFKEIQPNKYYRAEIKAAQKAVTVTDKEQQYIHKVQQLANHYMYREAIDVKDRMTKHRKYVKSVQTREYNTKQVNPEYVQNMKSLANLYDMRQKPDQQVAVNHILEWYMTQINDPNQFVEIELLDVNLIRALEAKQDGRITELSLPKFDDLTAQDLQGLHDMLRHLRYVGGVMSDIGKAEFNATVESVFESIIEHGGADQKRTKGIPRKGEQLKRGVSHMVNKIPSLRNLVRKLDGFKSDVVHDAIYRQVEDANSNKIDLAKELYEKFDNELHEIYKIGLVRTDNKSYLLDSGLTLDMHSESRFMMALYWGTESSRDAIRDGFGVSDGDVSRILADLTPEQLKLINAVWKVNESMWPELSSASVKMLGVAPPKLDATPFIVNGVEMSGGHMRLIYDSSELELKNEQEQAGKMASVVPSRAGSLYARVGSGGRPPLLDKNNIARALEDNVHYIAFAETGRRIAGIVNHKSVKGAIEQKHGEGFNKAFIENLENITGNRPARESIPTLAAMFRLLRRAATFKHLAYSIRNTVQQITAIPVSMEEVGTVPFIGAITRFASPNGNKDITDFVNARSAFMRDRASLVNREAAEYLRKVEITGKAHHMWDQFARYGFTPQTIVDATIAYPTWIAKYEQQFEAHGDDKRAASEADTAVAETVGSGSDLHLGGAFQSNQSELVRTLTLFGTWFNAYYQRMYKSTEGFTTADMGTVKTMLVTPFIVAILSSIIIMDYPEDESDESWEEWALKRYVSFMGGTIPLVRDIVGSFSGFAPKTVLGGGQETPARFIKEFEAFMEGRQSGLKTTSDVTKLVTTIVPVPGVGNVTRVMDFVDSNSQGRESGSAVKKTYQAFVEGPNRNK